MKLIPRFACHATVLLFLLSFPLSGFSQSSPDGKQALADQLVRQLALQQQLEEAPDDIRMQFEQNPLNLPAKKNKRMLELFSDAYKSERLLDDFKSALREQLTDELAAELSQKLSDPDIRAVTNAQQEFYTLQGKRKRIVTKYELEQQAPSPERSSAISALTDTTSEAAGSVESSIVILRSVIKALGSLSEQHSFSDRQIDAVADNFRTQMEAGASQQTSDRLMVTYYHVDTGSLDRYVTFMQSDTGQWLDRAISQSIQSAYKAASERFLQAVDTP
ncbi:hypothetical protein SAMN05443144_11075 [Fodinibius roseus]|uniref:DUF2059 domain-containing protein n=1 Tax=Fodinibius roseus TaxID=1194090 RepID=A0A1M5CSC5_9BACT|nr:hypothetical protein [Fodinibius roseus]SHF57675.1 hypothetical protein SAMN05443144_11075 [Fodinibius roseus]